MEVGPYTCISGTVKIGPNTIIAERVSIEGHTTIGAENEIFAGAIIGSRTQDKIAMRHLLVEHGAAKICRGLMRIKMVAAQVGKRVNIFAADDTFFRNELVADL